MTLYILGNSKAKAVTRPYTINEKEKEKITQRKNIECRTRIEIFEERAQYSFDFNKFKKPYVSACVNQQIQTYYIDEDVEISFEKKLKIMFFHTVGWIYP